MNRVMIIAEAGVNHNGSMELAKKLIDAAAEAQADYVKFQTFNTERLVGKHAKKADYQIKNMDDEDNTQFNMLKKLELTDKMHEELIEYCEKKNIKFLSTAFDFDSIDFLTEKKVPFFKIPSGEITNLPYLKKIALKGKPVVLSTGMADIDEVKAAVQVLLKYGVPINEITVLHCNTEYPTPMEDVNLLAMLHIQRELGVKVGYSDHTLGIEVPIAAVALGASVIEKHFTLDRNLPGPDHAASLEPEELKTMIQSIRNIEKALSGSGLKEPSPSERRNISIVRKSIVASKKIKAGEIFNESNLDVKRPGTGISPMKWEDVLGRTANRNFEVDDIIEL